MGTGTNLGAIAAPRSPRPIIFFIDRASTLDVNMQTNNRTATTTRAEHLIV